jgi:hypothetical protein
MNVTITRVLTLRYFEDREYMSCMQMGIELTAGVTQGQARPKERDWLTHGWDPCPSKRL